jgi:hypothetical protein
MRGIPDIAYQASARTGLLVADATIPGYVARPGWDAVTGLGTRDVAKLLPDLIVAVAATH